MSIDKESDGMPEVNAHRPGTKVNLGIIVGVLLFLAFGAVAAVWISQRDAATAGAPAKIGS